MQKEYAYLAMIIGHLLKIYNFVFFLGDHDHHHDDHRQDDHDDDDGEHNTFLSK